MAKHLRLTGLFLDIAGRPILPPHPIKNNIGTWWAYHLFGTGCILSHDPANTVGLRIWNILYYRPIIITGADPGFEKGGAQGVLGLAIKNFLANLGDFKKNSQKWVGVRRPPLPLDPCLNNILSICLDVICLLLKSWKNKNILLLNYREELFISRSKSLILKIKHACLIRCFLLNELNICSCFTMIRPNDGLMLFNRFRCRHSINSALKVS